MKIGVTGSSGFIGSQFAQSLAGKSDLEIVDLGRREFDLKQKNFRHLKVAYDNPNQLAEALRGADALIHCAGKAGLWGPYQDYYQANVGVTKTLLDVCKSLGVKKFINISSSSVYFRYRDQFNLCEGDIPNSFVNAYAKTKFEAENLVSAAHCAEFSTLSLRPRGVIGVGDLNWLPRIVDLNRKGRLIQVGNGQNLADFTSIENLCVLLKTCLDAPHSSFGRVYNVSNGRPEPLWNVIEQGLQYLKMERTKKIVRIPRGPAIVVAKGIASIYKAFGTKVEPKVLPVTFGIAGYSMTLDISLARKHLTYTPDVSTTESLKKFATRYRH